MSNKQELHLSSPSVVPTLYAETFLHTYYLDFFPVTFNIA